MGMPGRTYTSGNQYRYGFNGQEKSTEIDGSENLYTAQFWEYDSRIGRRWNLDPRLVIGISPYSTFLNNPIIFSDLLGDTTINGQKMEGVNAASATYLSEVVVKAKKKYVPEQDFAHNPLTGYNSKTGSAYALSNTATVKSLAKDFLLNWQGSNGRSRNTIIVGGPLLDEVKSLESVKRLFIQGLKDLNNKKFKPGSYFKGFYQMSDLNGKDGDLMKTEVLEDLLNGKSFTDSRFFSAQFFLGSFDFSMRVTNDGKYIALTVYDSKTVQSLTDGGKKALKNLFPLESTLPTYQRYLWPIPIEKVKQKYAEAAESIYKSIK